MAALTEMAHATPTVVAIEGQAAPDGNGTISFISNDFGFNDSGEVVYEVQYTGLSDGRLNEKAIVVADGVNPDWTVARGGFTVPQGGFKGLFSPRINNAGEVVFIGFINDTAGGDANLETLFVASPTNVYTEAAREGTNFPGYTGTQSPAWYRDFSSGDALSEMAGNARVVMFATLSVGSFGVERGLFGFDGTSDFLISRTGDANLGLGDLIGINFIDANEGGDFAADITTATTRGVVTATFGGFDPRTVIQVGEVFAGGATAFVGEPSINADRDVAFRANLPGGARAIGAYDHATATRTVVAATGDAAPGGGTFSFLTGPQINDAGVVAFVGRVGTAASVFTYDPATAAITRVVGEGDALEGSTIQALGFEIELNSSGKVAFDFRLADGRDGYAVTAATAAPCVADVTTTGSASGMPDGVVDLSDFSFYLTLWSGSDPAADLTTTGSANGVPDGVVDLSDFSVYLTLWAAGCP